jgi:hypothetical protein
MGRIGRPPMGDEPRSLLLFACTRRYWAGCGRRPRKKGLGLPYRSLVNEILASDIGDCHSVIFDQISDDLHSDLRQLTATAPVSQFRERHVAVTTRSALRLRFWFACCRTIRASASLRMRSTNRALPKIRRSLSSRARCCRYGTVAMLSQS